MYSVAFKTAGKGKRENVGMIGLYHPTEKATVYFDVISYGFESFGFAACEYKYKDESYVIGQNGVAEIYGYQIQASEKDGYIYIQVFS